MFQVYVFPLNIKGGSASPSRVVAIWGEDDKPTCGATYSAASILLMIAAVIYVMMMTV